MRDIVIKTTEYNDQSIFRVTYDTLKYNNEKLDVYFYRTHFFHPYYLPARFIDSHYKDTTISFWNNAQAAKDYQANSENTYTFDSTSRINRFSYSGCKTCSKAPYDYFITYNDANQVIKISSLKTTQESYSFEYNAAGELNVVNCITDNKLTVKIMRVN